MKVTFGGISPTQKVKIPVMQKVIIPHNRVSPEVMQKINNFEIKTIGVFKKNGWLKDVITYNKNKTIERIEGFYPNGNRGYLARFKPNETSIGIFFHKNGVKSSIGLFDAEGQTTQLKLIRPDKTLKYTSKINPDGGLTEAYFSVKSIIEKHLRFDANDNLRESRGFYPGGDVLYTRKINPDNTSLQKEYYKENGSLKTIAAINADMKIIKQRHFYPDRKLDYAKELNSDGTFTEKHFKDNKLEKQFEYDAENNIKTIRFFRPDKKLDYTKELNPDGSFIQTNYNENGKRVLIANIDSNDLIQKSTQFHPDGKNKSIVVEYNPDRSYTIEYFADDANETLEVRETYTPLEKIKTSTSFHPSNKKRDTELEFNPDGSFTKKYYALDGETLEEVQELDQSEQMKKSTKLFPNGQENIVVKYNPDGSFIQNEYTINKKIISEIKVDAQENLITSKVKHLNGKNKYTKERNPDGSFTECGYDREGNLNTKAQVDKNNQLIRLEQYYDPRNVIDDTKVEYTKERNLDGSFTEQFFNEYSYEPQKTIQSDSHGKIIEIRETLENGVIKCEKFDKNVTKASYYNEFGEKINLNNDFEELLEDSDIPYDEFGPVVKIKDFQVPEEFHPKLDKQDISGEFLMEDDTQSLFDQGAFFSKN